ncbi:MAG: 3-deoxy-manno-octulosonate cytidylyltransferase, partial [SAR324 cluster bacterium]|nr:3-deoxy-manno-octulosonate cytidylyltransferase [SAR324 cluster bacterium]
PVPYARDQVFRGCWKHFGVYLYRRDFLLEFANWPSTPLEQQEQLEQLRVLENGYSILCVESPVDSIGVDVPEDLTHVAQLIATGMIPD